MSWEFARPWACHALKGAAANNAIWTKGAVHGADRPLVRERGMRLPSGLGMNDCINLNLSFVICHLSFERASGELRYAVATATYFAAILGKAAISSTRRDRITLPGEPNINEPGGTLVPLVTNV